MKKYRTFLGSLLLLSFIAITNFGQERPDVAYPVFSDQLGNMPQLNKGNPYNLSSITEDLFQNGADRLVSLQYTDGSWGWPLNAPPTYANIVGPIAMGLAQAYYFTGDADHLTALSNAGAYLLTKTTNFSPSDGYLAATLDQIFGGSTYVQYVKDNYYDPLAAGIYNRNGAGTLYNTASYVELIRTNRSGSQANLAAWDIGMGLVGAAMCGASTAEWIAGVKAEINELDGSGYYDVIGLAGALYGLAYVGEEFDPTAGEHTAASNLMDLANILAGYQIDLGGFAYNSNYVIPNDNDEAIQETAYAILALNEVNRQTFLSNITGAGNYLKNTQLASGGWENYIGGGENNEVTGEALWGVHTSFPELWVATTGNDANSGSIYSPLATVQQAVVNIPFSGTINVEAGTYSEGSPQIIIDKDITISGEDKNTVIIQPAQNTGSSGDSRGWFLVNSGVTFNLSNVTLDGTGKNIYMAILSHGSGTIDNNIIKKIRYSDYLGMGVMAYGANMTLSNNTLTDIERIGLYCNGATVTNCIFSGNNYTGKGDGVWLDYGIEVENGANATITNNTISNCKGVASDGSTSAGCYITTYFAGGSSADYSNNNYTNNFVGIQVGYPQDNTYSETSSVTAHNNSFSGNDYGIHSTAPIVNATNNWWGDATGPYHPTLNPTGLGDPVSDFVVFDPWTAQLTVTQINTIYSFPSSGVDIEFSTLPSGGGTVTVQRYNEAPTGYPDPLAGAAHAGLWIDFSSSMADFSFNATVTVDVTGLGFDATNSVMYYNSETDSWVAVTGGSYDAGPPETYTFTINHFTPFSFINTPSTAYNVYLSSSTTAAAGIIYPNTDWGVTAYDPDDWDFTTPITIYIVPEVGSVFGASDITIEWNNTLFSYDDVVKAGGIYDGANFLFFYNQLGNTDQVTINASALTNTNFTISAGDYIAKLQLNLLKPGFGPISFTSLDFRAFDGSGGQNGVYVVGNNASVKSYLGDVATSGDESTGDGQVDFNDLTLWSNSYWSGVAGYSGGMTNYKVKYDVGPTSDNTVYGLPQTDGKIQFEDLMIFAMSYGLSGDNVYPKISPVPEIPVELYLGEPIAAGNETRVPVMVAGGVQNIRAMELSFAGQFGKLLSVEKGELLEGNDNPVMVMSREEGGRVYVDFALFGAEEEGISREGEVLVLRFEGKAGMNISSANVRNVQNKEMMVKITGKQNSIPMSYGLSQNYPNPFNPSTTISYQIPEQQLVTLRIYNALGEKVAELVNEVQQAGYYEVQMNGVNLSSGVYYYQISAGDYSSVKKMLLVK